MKIAQKSKQKMIILLIFTNKTLDQVIFPLRLDMEIY